MDIATRAEAYALYLLPFNTLVTTLASTPHALANSRLDRYRPAASQRLHVSLRSPRSTTSAG